MGELSGTELNKESHAKETKLKKEGRKKNTERPQEEGIHVTEPVLYCKTQLIPFVPFLIFSYDELIIQRF